MKEMANTAQAQESQVLIDLKNGLLRLDDNAKRREHAFNYIKKLTPDAVVELFESVAQQTLEWEAEHAIFVLFIDQLSIYRRLGKNSYRTYWQKLQISSVLRKSLTLLTEIRDRAPEEIVYLQALFNVWLQITLTVNERVVQNGYAPLDISLTDLLNVLWRDKDFETLKVVLDRDEFPEHSRPILIKILEELDFVSVAEGLYELELAESTIEELAAGAIIRSQKKKGADSETSGKLTDAIIQRQAEMLLRKIIFAIRGLSMYPPGHPGLKNTFDSALETIKELMEGRRMCVVTQLAGSVLVNEVRIKSEDRFVTQIIEIMEERGISSITFLPGLTATELEILVKLFNFGISALKDEGGPRAYLLNNGVDHVILDQYRYGVISADEEIVPIGSINYGGGGYGGGFGGAGGADDGGDGGDGGTGGSASGGDGMAGAGAGGDGVASGDGSGGSGGSGGGTGGGGGAGTSPGGGGRAGLGRRSGVGGSGGYRGGVPGGGKLRSSATAVEENEEDDLDIDAASGGMPGYGGYGGPGGPGGYGAGGYGGYGGGGIARGPGRNAEIVLLNEIVSRASAGGGAMTDISNDEVGLLFKRILSGEVDRHQEFRKSLAELIVSLDPDFLQRAIIDSPDVRERLSWSVSRRIINKTIQKMDSDNLDERMSAMEVLQHIGELAVVRRKDSSLRQILAKLSEQLEKNESDPDTCLQLADNIGALISRVIVNGNLKIALDFLKEIREAGDKLTLHPSRRYFAFRLEAIDRLFQRVSTPETVRYLIRQLGKDKQSIAVRSIKLLEMLKTEEVVVQLLSVFERSERRERQRAFNVLLKIPDVSGSVIVHHLSVMADREYFPRKHDNVREMIDEAYYRVRNSLGVLAEIRHNEAPAIFKAAAHDQDYRIRKETISVLMGARHSLTMDIARSLLKDPEEEVRSLAILAMRNPSGEHVVGDLIQLFMNEPNLRRQILETLAGIDDRRSREFLSQCLLLTEPVLRDLYIQNVDLQLWAIHCIAQNGALRELKQLQAFKERFSSLYRRLRLFPLRYVMKSAKVLEKVNEAIGELEKNLVDAEQDMSLEELESLDQSPKSEDQ